MQLKEIKGKGWIPFPKEFSLDLDSLNGKVTAVTGFNGAGKSSFLELFPACLFRKLPTRGSLKDFAVTRDAFIECTVVNGSEYRIRQTVDAISGKAETSLTDSEGRAVLTSAKVTEFDQWAAKHLPQPSVFYSSVFTAQGSKGLLGMNPGERKAVILRELGLEYYETLAQLARQHKSEVERELVSMRARIAELGTFDLVNLRSETEGLERELARTHERLAEAEQELAEARKRAAAIEKQTSEYHAAYALHHRAVAEKDRVLARIADLAERIANNQALMKDAEDVRAAVARSAELTATLGDLNRQESDLKQKRTERDAERRRLVQTEETLTAQVRTLKRAISQASAILQDRVRILNAADSIEPLQSAQQEASSNRQAAVDALEEFRQTATTSSGERITHLRSSLRSIAESETDSPQFFASGAIEDDDKVAKAADEYPATVQQLKDELTRAERQLSEASQNLAQAQQLAAHKPETERAEASKSEAEAALSEAERAEVARAADYQAAVYAVAELDKEIDRLMVEKRGLESEQASLLKVAERVSILDGAETRIAEYERQRVEAQTELEGIVVPDLPNAPPIALNLSTYESAVTSARQSLGEYRTRLTVAQSKLGEAEEKEARHSTLTAEARQLEEQVSDWTRLAQDLGRDGLQALEIDCAGPEITTLANDLLRSCGDTRFTVQVETTRQSADGKRELEGCEIVVMDSKTGITKTGEQLSGGEAVFVSEALSLALAMLGCKRSGVANPTIVRDETGAALDSERAPQYIAMLRRAGELVGASKVLFVAHNPDLWALADSRIDIRDGAISIH